MGKKILFTDNHDWKDAQRVRGYRAQHHIEDAFRNMKDSDCLAIRPQYHWTDNHIRVHVFCCVIAFMLCALLQRELYEKGFELSIEALFKELKNIQEVDFMYPSKRSNNNPSIKTSLSQMSKTQPKIFEALDLQRYSNRVLK